MIDATLAARLDEQVALARELFPNAHDIRPVWKAASQKSDVGADVRYRDQFTGALRGKVVSCERNAHGQAVVL